LAQNILPLQNSGYYRRVSAGPSDSKVFQGFYQSSFRVSWRRLRKMLLRFDSEKVEGLTLGEVRESFVGFPVFRLIFALFVEGQKSLENDHRADRSQGIIARRNVYGSLIYQGRGHLACYKPFPDKGIEVQLVFGEVL